MLLKLKNVSKFYYSNGIIASGFNRVNVEFTKNEFVAIVGESGSGKSTLLNVISGLDSYEEGEMYINGEETSHYTEEDYLEYRRKYVSNIFQSFNLVNSYNVYQNIELVLLMNGCKKKDIKDKVLELIDKVGLSKYKKTKVSKLSGGQKQRVAIARALARETPIIVCDEPTGNLDSKSAKNIISLLKEISHDKLVIIVTHNYDEVKDLATRVIKMHDGKIESDKKIKEVIEDKEEIKVNEIKDITLLNKIRLGVRNTFNIIPKFILIFIVFLFISASLLLEYGAFQRMEYEEKKSGENEYFTDTSSTRIVIKKENGEYITQDEIVEIKNLENVDTVVYDDKYNELGLFFDSYTTEYDYSGYYFYAYLKDISEFTEKVDYGRMPENDNEGILVIGSNDYYFYEERETAISKDYYLGGDTSAYKMRIVGVKYDDKANDNILYSNSEKILNSYKESTNNYYFTIKININNHNYTGYEYKVYPSSRVSKGNVIIPESYNYMCKDYNCKNKSISIEVSNLYFTNKISYNVSNTYNNKNISSVLGIDKDDHRNGYIFINPEDYQELFKNNVSYQSSVYVINDKNIDSVIDNLNKMGYKTLKISDTLNGYGNDISKIIKIFKLIVTIGLIGTLFLISYFVIKLILKSRNIYYATLRILGANAKNIKRILDIELFTNATIAYIFYIIIIMLVKDNIINITIIRDICDYLKLSDYIIVYLLLILISYLISSRYARKIFKKSTMMNYRENV